jgi:transmembrane sensor
VAGLGGISALLVMVGVLWQAQERQPGLPATPASASVVSVPERRLLQDGSVVELNAGARITVDYRLSARRVVLTRGEAHFQVAKNHAVPFIVAAGGVEIRAVGTAFSVNAAPAGVELLVTEGRVAVGAEDAEMSGSRVSASPRLRVPVSSPVPFLPPVYVDAGNRLIMDALPPPGLLSNPHVTPVSPAEMDERLAWRVPRIEFSGTPLVEAIPVFNRHSRVRVMLGDPGIGRLQLSGILRADNVDALVRLLEANYGVVADRRENGIMLRKTLAPSKPD